jgi:hypothetical protein
MFLLRADRRLPAAAALPGAVFAALRLAGTERGFPLVPAMAFAPHPAATALLPLALGVAARSPVGAVASAVAGAALAVPIRAVRHPLRAPEPAGERLRAAGQAGSVMFVPGARGAPSRHRRSPRCAGRREPTPC